MKNSIFLVPEIDRLWRAWQATVTPECFNGDRDAHNAFVSAVKAEQIARGQRREVKS